MASTDIGNINRNGQQVIRKTDLPGTDHGQVIYVLRCNKYGCNGTQVYERKCPKCQDGKPGLTY